MESLNGLCGGCDFENGFCGGRSVMVGFCGGRGILLEGLMWVVSFGEINDGLCGGRSVGKNIVDVFGFCGGWSIVESSIVVKWEVIIVGKE